MGPPPLGYFQIFALTRYDEISVEFAFWQKEIHSWRKRDSLDDRPKLGNS
jgi:hypothetical protein